MNHNFDVTKKMQSGFSLVQILVVMAIMSVLALAIGTLITSMTNQQAHLTKAFEKQAVFDSLRLTLSSPDCATLLGIQGLNLTALQNGVDSVSLIDNSSISATTARPDGLIADGQIRFFNQQDVGDQVKPHPTTGVATNYKLWSATMSTSATTNGIVLKKSNGSQGSFDTFKAMPFTMVLMADATGRVDYCYATGNTNDQTCQEMLGGNYDSAEAIKCRLGRLTVSDAHQNDVGASATNSTFSALNALSVFGTGAMSLNFETATGSAAGYTMNGTAQTGQINYATGTGFSIAPRASTPTTSLDLGSSDALFRNFQRVNISQVAGAPGTPALAVAAPTNATPGLAVTGSSNFNGNMTLTGTGGNVFAMTGNSNFAGSMNVTGNITVGGQVTASSDRRLKTDIKDMTDALNRISQIQGVTYLKKGGGDKHEMGVLAQDVQKVFPEAVVEREDGYLAVNYSALVAPLIESVKELKSEQDDLKAQLEQIKRELASLKKKK